jgi:hypothetical protein
MFRYIKGGMVPVAAALWDPETKKYIFDQLGQHRVMVKQWRAVFDKHKAAPPQWEQLRLKYGHYDTGCSGAPQELPTGELLYARAQRAKEDKAGGSDGWKPMELKALPKMAWTSRAEVLKLSSELGRFPQSYRTVYMAAIGKTVDSNEALDHRLLSLFSCLYRIEGGAWFELLTPWLRKAIHKDVVGATAGKEALDVAWAAQGYIEESMCKGIAAVLSSYDFSKYFDSFDHDLTKQLLLHLGVPELLVNLMHNLYKDMQRIMKKGKSLSEAFGVYNGYGQGDVLSLIPALLLVSFQFRVIEAKLPLVKMGAYMDDRNFRGQLEDLLQVDNVIHDFDHLAGHATQGKKTAFIATCKKDKEKLKKTLLQGTVPKLPLQIVIVGYGITASRRKQCKAADNRSKKAKDTACRIDKAPLGTKRRKVAVESKTIPTAIYGMNWSTPSLTAARALRASIMKCIWGRSSRMRCIEIVIGVLKTLQGLTTPSQQY